VRAELDLVKAWAVDVPGPIDDGPLVFEDRPTPEPGPGQVRVRISVCGVCRTDLHVAEGDLPAHRPHVVPGHEIVGYVDALGPSSTRFSVGDRIGAAWLHRSCGRCRWCRRGRENLCLQPTFTGWDQDGGFAEMAVVEEQFAYVLPDGFTDEQVAPLLCAGIIGYRALRLTDLPPGGTLGIYGFGASGHITAQIAMAQGARVHVMTQSERARQLATQLGAASVGDAYAQPPEALDAAILFAPVGTLVPPALAALDRGGTLAIAGIHLTDIPRIDYAAELFQERRLRSVTANTRQDGEELLALATRLALKVTTSPYPLEAAEQALVDLAHDRVDGAAVLRVGSFRPD
jgi:propanol-preferring alcohol dehydrogenase